MQLKKAGSQRKSLKETEGKVRKEKRTENKLDDHV